MIPATLDALLERVAESLMRLRADKRALLDLARQYARTCGDCAGTRVCTDGRPCDSCPDIWRVIDQVEGRT